ncbi:MAG TPA: hypothetical protein VFN51_03765 [Candidatus Saccharimonadales bacterium]|nr:hypothetical protein [Candidatus Saccharimonadales bacterium]
MSPENRQPRELTPEEIELGDYLIEECGLHDVADTMLEMYGQSESVRYGLGHSGKYLLDRTPEEIRLMVLAKLHEQQTLSSAGSDK